jgi:hypothetical protein
LRAVPAPVLAGLLDRVACKRHDIEQIDDRVSELEGLEPRLGELESTVADLDES